MVLGPLRGGVEVGDVEILVQERQVRFPPEPGRRRDEANGRAAHELPASQQRVDHAAMPDEVDLLEVRSAVGDTRAREQRVHRPAALVERGVDRRRVTEVNVHRLRAGKLDLGEVHHHDLGACVVHKLRDGCAHPGRTTDDERPLVVVAKSVEQ